MKMLSLDKEAHIVHAKKIKNVNDNNLHFTLE